MFDFHIFYQSLCFTALSNKTALLYFLPLFYRREQISLEAPELLGAQFDSHTRSGTQKMGAPNQVYVFSRHN